MNKIFRILMVLFLILSISNIASAEAIISIVTDSPHELKLNTGQSKSPNNAQIKSVKWWLVSEEGYIPERSGQTGLYYTVYPMVLDDGEYDVVADIEYEDGYRDSAELYFIVREGKIVHHFNYNPPPTTDDVVRVKVNSPSTPGFTTIFGIIGLLTVAYLFYRKRDD